MESKVTLPVTNILQDEYGQRLKKCVGITGSGEGGGRGWARVSGISRPAISRPAIGRR